METTAAADVEDDDTAAASSHLLHIFKPQSTYYINYILGIYRANRLIILQKFSLYLAQPHNYCCKGYTGLDLLDLAISSPAPKLSERFPYGSSNIQGMFFSNQCSTKPQISVIINLRIIISLTDPIFLFIDKFQSSSFTLSCRS